MKSIYRNENAKKAVFELYDRQIEELNIPYKDLYVDTSFGKTHLIECGNLNGKPLLVFHGGNSTTAYNLKYSEFLFRDFHIYAVDTIGHPGKSSENVLSPNGQDYGKWAVEVIKALKYEKMMCFGSSYGAGILVKAMCVASEVIEKSVLIVPSAIKNAPLYKSMNMAFPMIMYWLTHKEKWLVKCFLPITLTEDGITDDFLATARCSIDNVKIKSVMPKNESSDSLMKYHNPVLVMAAEKDKLFPADNVLPVAKKVWQQSVTYLLKDRGHLHTLTDTEEKMIINFLLS